MVSVLVPVYKASAYLEEAVHSALNCPEVGEIILIEDGSPDNSLEVCKMLEQKFDKVKLYQHINGENKGASESRNLGILRSEFDLISFLDADDIYLANRFKRHVKLLAEQGVDGVYGTVSYIDSKGTETGRKFGIKHHQIAPRKLTRRLIRGTYGHFHTNSFTIKKKVLENIKWFDPRLKLHQDSELWIRISANGDLVSDELGEPIAQVRTHDLNRISGANKKSRTLFWRILISNSLFSSMKASDKLMILMRYINSILRGV
ncbi:glycosyltransferase family 2 protein [Roseivirga pacifica]|uniref:glycosyltransferase family 2 protein n=1 Tax=Roseivirga pacifica TaxID=1267423 RepID=UPI00227AE953|nr:glycosyltransferase family 2 protein [Roseivirga pacifica]